MRKLSIHWINAMLKKIAIFFSILFLTASGFYLFLVNDKPVAAVLAQQDGDFLDFAFNDLQGQSRQLKEWQGQVVLLNLWATWCPPCRREMPDFVELQKEYASKGFIVVAIAMDNADASRNFARQFGLNFPVLIGEMNAKSLQLAKKLGNANVSLPYTAIINRQGQIMYRQAGQLTAPRARSIIEPLLIQAATEPV